MPHDDRPTVYSTEKGDLRKSPGKAQLSISLPPQQQNVLVARESKGRGGKVVSLVKNLQLSPDDLKALSTILKQSCGAGGTIKVGVIEIQGDHREIILETLRSLGYKVKIAGG